MGWSIRVARVAGTEVKVHVTFLLLLAWVWFTHYRVGGTGALCVASTIVAGPGVERRATVGEQGRARDVVGRVRSKPGSGLGDVLRPADAAAGNERERPPQSLWCLPGRAVAAVLAPAGAQIASAEERRAGRPEGDEDKGDACGTEKEGGGAAPAK